LNNFESFLIQSRYFNGFARFQIIDGGFKNQPQKLMFSSSFSEFHIEEELVVNLYR